MLSVRLQSYPNPDRNEVLPPAPAFNAEVLDEAQAAALARAYINIHDLGGGNWGTDSGAVTRDGTVIGRVSYNGRFWPVEQREGVTA